MFTLLTCLIPLKMIFVKIELQMTFSKAHVKCFLYLNEYLEISICIRKWCVHNFTSVTKQPAHLYSYSFILVWIDILKIEENDLRSLIKRNDSIFDKSWWLCHSFVNIRIGHSNKIVYVYLGTKILKNRLPIKCEISCHSFDCQNLFPLL